MYTSENRKKENSVTTTLPVEHIAVNFWAATDVGRVRPVNQDRFLIDHQLDLVIVADGVGGRKRGEVAAELACQVVREHIERNPKPRAKYLANPQPEARKSVVIMMRNALQKASAQVFSAGRDIASGVGMSCTLDAVLIIGKTAFIAHVGDSRTYLIRNQKAYPLTEDHTVLQEKVRRGALTPEEAKTAKGGNILTRAIGSLPTVQVDTVSTEISPGDGLLLCSDGLTRYVIDAEIPRALPNYSAMAIENLVGLARARGGGDNITALVIGVINPKQHIQSNIPTKLLRELPFLEGCTLDELRSFWNISEIRDIESGSTVFQESTSADEIYFLVDGIIELHRGERCIDVIYPGQPFGNFSLVSDNLRMVTAIAEDNCTLLCLGRHRFFQLLNEQSPIANRILLQMFNNTVNIVRKQNIPMSEDCD